MTKKELAEAQKAKPKNIVATRLDLSTKDDQRLAAVAQRKGLSKASFARMAVLERIEEDERRQSAKQ